ncbi:MAG: RNA methyltransferase [Myxococcales bacterium]|nr:RNA methyltransferase [Myxococcales bacterium]
MNQERQHGDELKICGMSAALVSAARRPHDVLRVFLRRDRSHDFRDLLALCADARKPFRFVEDDELARVAGTRHHQGICLVMWAPSLWRHDDVLRAAQFDRNSAQRWLFLDRVGNPHNLGAIARTAAHFGVTALLTPDWPDAAGYSTASFRTAEGGFESVPLARLRQPLDTLEALRTHADTQLLATASDGPFDLWRDDPPRRAVWMVGTEQHGLAPELFEMATATVAIGGTGAVESLNVSAAAALVLGASWRAHG